MVMCCTLTKEFLLSQCFSVSATATTVLFQYIRECIASDSIPQLMLNTRQNMYSTLPDTEFIWPAYMQRGEILYLVHVVVVVTSAATSSLLPPLPFSSFTTASVIRWYRVCFSMVRFLWVVAVFCLPSSHLYLSPLQASRHWPT